MVILSLKRLLRSISLHPQKANYLQQRNAYALPHPKTAIAHPHISTTAIAFPNPKQRSHPHTSQKRFLGRATLTHPHIPKQRFLGRATLTHFQHPKKRTACSSATLTHPYNPKTAIALINFQKWQRLKIQKLKYPTYIYFFHVQPLDKFLAVPHKQLLPPQYSKTHFR